MGTMLCQDDMRPASLTDRAPKQRAMLGFDKGEAISLMRQIDRRTLRLVLAAVRRLLSDERMLHAVTGTLGVTVPEETLPALRIDPWQATPPSEAAPVRAHAVDACAAAPGATGVF